MARRGSWALAVAGLLGLATSLVSAAAATSATGSPFSTWAGVLGLTLPVYATGTAALLLRRDHLTARWLSAVGAWLAIATGMNMAGTGLAADVGARATVALNTLQVAAMFATVVSIACLLVVFPDRDYRYRYQRRATRLLWTVPVGMLLVWPLAHPTAFVGSVVWPHFQTANPFAVPALAPAGHTAETLVLWRTWLWTPALAALLVRYRQASSTVRVQLKWPLTAAVVFALLWGLSRFLQHLEVMVVQGRGLPHFSGWLPGLALLTVSMLIALLRHRLLEVDLWLRRTVLYGVLSLVLAIASLGLAGLLGVAAGQRASLGLAVVVTLAAVTLVEPARRKVEGAARRWVFGHSLPGDELLRRVGNVLEDTHDPDRLGATLAATIVDGLRLEWVRVHLDAAAGRSTVQTAGSLDPNAAADLVAPLTHGGETVGRIECGPRRSGELSPADEQLLAGVARQAALAILNARLTARLERQLVELHRQADELAASRGRIVQAQTAERRRIERALHDGVQQDIVGTIASLRLARNQVGREPAQAAATLADLQAHTTRTLANLRELSRGIHPLVLTHRGLVEALDAQIGRLPLTVELDASPEVARSRYDQDVEVAAYFVVCEGLTNVIKHAGTGAATVTLAVVNEHLNIEVADDGRGLEPTGRFGSGLVGLRDRVDSLGGRFEVDGRPGGGARLRASLPAYPGGGATTSG